MPGHKDQSSQSSNFWCNGPKDCVLKTHQTFTLGGGGPDQFALGKAMGVFGAPSASGKCGKDETRVDYITTPTILPFVDGEDAPKSGFYKGDLGYQMGVSGAACVPDGFLRMALDANNDKLVAAPAHEGKTTSQHGQNLLQVVKKYVSEADYEAKAKEWVKVPKY